MLALAPPGESCADQCQSYQSACGWFGGIGDEIDTVRCAKIDAANAGDNGRHYTRARIDRPKLTQAANVGKKRAQG